jgi:hypothetical protein
MERNMTFDPSDPHLHNEDSYEERVEKLVMLTVGVAKDILPAGQIGLLFYQIAHGTIAPPEIRSFVKVLIQITQGERDPDAGAHLPSDLAQAVKETIERIEAPPAVGEASVAEPETEGLTLIELLERVGEACGGNVALWQQLWRFTEQLESEPTTPPNIKALALVLRKILAGERQSCITEDLPPELAGPVNVLLEALLKQAVSPLSSYDDQT